MVGVICLSYPLLPDGICSCLRQRNPSHQIFEAGAGTFRVTFREVKKKSCHIPTNNVEKANKMES